MLRSGRPSPRVLLAKRQLVPGVPVVEAPRLLIKTRTHRFSIGVILYELLAGPKHHPLVPSDVLAQLSPPPRQQAGPGSNCNCSGSSISQMCQTPGAQWRGHTRSGDAAQSSAHADDCGSDAGSSDSDRETAGRSGYSAALHAAMRTRVLLHQGGVPVLPPHIGYNTAAWEELLQASVGACVCRYVEGGWEGEGPECW